MKLNKIVCVCVCVLKIYNYCYIYLSFTLFFIAKISKMSSRKEGNVLFNDTSNTFYLPLYGVRYMVKDHSDSERGNPLQDVFSIFPTVDSREELQPITLVFIILSSE